MDITGGNALLDVNFILNKAQVGENAKVADLGCGASGHFVFPASKLVGKDGKVYAVDILKTNLENVNKRAKLENLENIKTVWSDLEIFGATKIEAGSLDVALLINTLYQSHKRAEIIREAVRMTKKDGKLVIVEWKSISSPLGPPVEERVKIDLLKAGAKKLGSNLEEEFEAGQYHYGLIFIKL
jgi:ubiquinone/menaquinone biosynthesis C-methylase UbiE